MINQIHLKRMINQITLKVILKFTQLLYYYFNFRINSVNSFFYKIIIRKIVVNKLNISLCWLILIYL